MLFWILLPVIALVMVALDFLTDRDARGSTLSFFLAAMFLGLLSLLLFSAGDMGLDYHGYKFFYENMPTFLEFFYGASFLPLSLEPGYQFIVMTAKSLGLGVRGPVLLLYLLACFIFLRGCKNAQLPPLTASALFILLIYPDFYGQQRMAFVCACGILILGYMKTARPLGIITMILLATTVQYVALAYFAALVWYILDKKNSNSRKFAAQRISIVLGGMKKIFSREKVIIIFPLVLGVSVAFLFTDANTVLILYGIEIFENGFAQNVPIIEKFMSYYKRNSIINLSFLGFAATTVFILIVLFTFTASSIYWKLRNGLVFLILSIFSFAIFSPLPFVSYRVVQMFYLAGLLYVGSTILVKKTGLYIGSAALIGLVIIRYLNLFSSLGPYSF